MLYTPVRARCPALCQGISFGARGATPAHHSLASRPRLPGGGGSPFPQLSPQWSVMMLISSHSGALDYTLISNHHKYPTQAPTRTAAAATPSRKGVSLVRGAARSAPLACRPAMPERALLCPSRVTP